MTIYVLAQNVAAVQTIADVGTKNQIVDIAPFSSDSNSPPSTQTFVLTVTGSGDVSGTAQILASLDGVNFVNYGSAIVAAAAPTTSSQAQVSQGTFEFYAAIITAIGGTNARATVRMGA